MPKNHFADIKPQTTKERSSLGVVELTLGEGQHVKAVGVVYGLEHTISGDGYEARLFLDQYNQRIKIQSYSGPNFRALILHIRWIAEANGFDKIICMATHDDWHEFLKHGYVLEAVLKDYFRGEEDAFAMSKFRSQERLISSNLMEEILLIEKIMHDSPLEPKKSSEALQPLPEGFTIRMADHGDIQELILLYQSIFESYPSPLVHTSYLETVFLKETLFAVCIHGGKIVSAASAELQPKNFIAELTDCATKPEARGQGIMSHLLLRLEKELVKKNYLSSYTMARARSYGMNNVFFRLDYEFMGRMVNNCDIYGAYEDMNIWVKHLKKKSEAGIT
jgi:beta-lysine N6-acetyltransferase